MCYNGGIVGDILVVLGCIWMVLNCTMVVNWVL